jgi:3-hydroxypropanoate dehydrogenase
MPRQFGTTSLQAPDKRTVFPKPAQDAPAGRKRLVSSAQLLLSPIRASADRPPMRSRAKASGMTMIDESARGQLFSGARTFSHWQERAVPGEVIDSAMTLALLGPTSGNCEPMRVVLVKSAAGKERLLPCVSSGNSEKVRTAPVTAIVAYDTQFYEYLPRLFPHTDARSWFTSNEALATETAFRNSSLQGAYFIMALRAHGLDCGPMSGFNPQAVDAAFFPDGRYRVNFLLNIGYGDRGALHPRPPRLELAEVADWV